MWELLEHAPEREPYRVFNTADLADRTGAQTRPVHDSGIQFHGAGQCQHGTPAGVEDRFVFELSYGRLHGIERAAAASEYLLAGPERCGDTGAVARLASRFPRSARSRPTVHHQRVHSGQA